MKKYADHILSLCWTEAGKKQVNIAQMREIIGIVTHMVATQPEFLAELLRVGIKKAKRIQGRVGDNGRFLRPWVYEANSGT